MLRSGAAASTEQSHSSVQEPVGVFGKILGSRHIHKSIPDPFGKASIWLSRKKLSIREPATHGFNDFQCAGRTKRTVDADDIGSQFAHHPGHSGRFLATYHRAIFTEGHACDDRDSGDAAYRGECLAHLCQVRDRL